MTIRMFFTILAVLSFLFGVGFVLAPDQVLANYGIEHSPALALLGRLSGFQHSNNSRLQKRKTLGQ
jgi:hypothetical protein